MSQWKQLPSLWRPAGSAAVWEETEESNRDLTDLRKENPNAGSVPLENPEGQSRNRIERVWILPKREGTVADHGKDEGDGTLWPRPLEVTHRGFLPNRDTYLGDSARSKGQQRQKRRS